MANINTLYGWEVSPFTAKVESYFNYKNIPFQKKVPSVFTLAKKIQDSVGKQIMPVVFDDKGDVHQDSTLIIDNFENLNTQNPVVPATPRQALVSRLIELHADEWLPMASLHYRWNYKENLDFILGEFGRSALPYFPKFIQRLAAKNSVEKMAGYLPILGITDMTQGALEINTETLLTNLDNHFSQTLYLLGARPTLGDFSLYGQIYAHLHRDPYPQNLVAKYSHLLAWLERIKDNKIPKGGELLADDKIPDSLMPILASISQNQFPLIEASINGLESWAQDKKQGDRVPGKFGDTQLNIDGSKESRVNLSFPYWKFQRISDLYQGFNADEKTQLDGLFTSLPQLSLIKQPLRQRVRLQRCRLYLEIN